MDGFDISEFEKYAQNLMDIAGKKMPKESKKFLQQEATKLKKTVLSVAKAKVNEHTGYYFKSIKKGRVYYYKPTGSQAVRIYSNAPHAHLIEYGHRAVVGGSLGRGKKLGTGSVAQKNGQEVFIPGKYVFETAQRQFESEFFEDAEKFIDEIMIKGVTK